jgi:hypothetical protein
MLAKILLFLIFVACGVMYVVFSIQVLEAQDKALSSQAGSR